MPKGLVNRERFSTTLSKKTVEKLKEYSAETLVPISKILDRAIMEYIEKQKKSR